MKITVTALVGLLGLALAGSAPAGPHGNAPSGCVDACAPTCAPTCCHACGQKSCRLVCDVKKIKKTVWVVECEEFCVPNPHCGHKKHSCQAGCKPDCTESCCEDVCRDCRRCLVPPRCGPVRCRKKLIKKEITCEIPIYRCVVCGTCCEQGCCEPSTPAKVDDARNEALIIRPSPTARRMRHNATR